LRHLVSIFVDRFIPYFEGQNFASIYKQCGDGQPDVFNRNRLEVCVAKCKYRAVCCSSLLALWQRTALIALVC